MGATGKYQKLIDGDTKRIAKEVQDELAGFYTKNILDLDAVCKKYGIELLDGTFDDDISGALIVKPEKVSVIVNRMHHLNRRRYTIGHELGHYFALKKGSFVAKDYVDRHDGVIKDASLFNRKADHSEDDYQAERQANIIASEILMPEMSVRNCIKTDMDLSSLAEEFGVSEQAMSYRLQILGIDTL